MDVITGVSADGSQRRTNRFVLNPTPEGPFHERSFSCMMQIYTVRHFMAQPVFHYLNSKHFQWSLRSERGKFFTGKVVFHYLDSVASRSEFILQVLRPPWVLFWLRIMWILNTNAVSLLGLQELPAAATQQTNHPARIFSDLATWYRKVCICPANFLHGSRELQTTATRRMNLQGWTSKHPGLGKQAKSKACRVGPARALVAVGNHRVLWHLASNHFVSTFDNDGIMAHPTHQDKLSWNHDRLWIWPPTVQLLEAKRKSIISPSVVHLRFRFRRVGDCDYFFVVSFIYVNDIFT